MVDYLLCYSFRSGAGPGLARRARPGGQERTVALLQVLRDRGGQLSMPHAGHLRRKIWELRVKARSGEYRLLYATVSERRILVLHGFKKTTQKAPPKEIALTEDRLEDFLRREG